MVIQNFRILTKFRFLSQILTSVIISILFSPQFPRTKKALIAYLDKILINYNHGWQKRRRTLLDGTEDDLCGETEHYKPCMDPLCYRPIKNQGQCRAENENCGLGIRENSWKCVRNNGKVVDKSLCQDIQLTTERCRLKCPGECVLSDWTNWTPCKSACTYTDGTIQMQNRVKIVTAEASVGFQKCPNSTLSETRECPTNRKSCLYNIF